MNNPLLKPLTNPFSRASLASRVLTVIGLMGALLIFGCTIANTYTVGGTVSRLQGTVVLQVNGAGNLPLTANGPFIFGSKFRIGAAYVVTVLTQPSNPNQTCTVANGSGTVMSASNNKVSVTCVYTTTALVTTEATNSGCTAPCNPGNNRVLIYNAQLASGQSANVVLGQPNFGTFAVGQTAATMNNPLATVEDRSGNLYVADDLNCRVVQFQPNFMTGMSATLALGQPNLTTATCPTVIGPATLGNNNAIGSDQVVGLSFDGSGNLWVADTGSNRVLEYKPPFATQMVASVAIGQPDLISGNPNQNLTAPTQSTLSNPDWITFDFSGNLWIPDVLNNRLLEFVPPFTTGMMATLVLGQMDFTQSLANQGAAGATAKTLNDALSAAFDISGNLWVADSANNRVLEYAPPFTTNMAATLVLGQADLTSNLPNQGLAAPTAKTLSFPVQVAFDSSGNLIVTDFSNNRTLEFTPPFAIDMPASLVLGQANFTSAAPATTVNGQDSPSGISVTPPL